ncbi:hypothetical protein [Sphingobium sp.]|uniref:hypothetical protein n=1 Tax=Sphingobium sp. TaxID=1912891 RepID=UPI0026349336|nr:hypothetical protein [Sphingobium sp.]
MGYREASPVKAAFLTPFRVLAFVIIVPLALAVKLVILPFERPVSRSPQEVARYLREFLDGTGNEGDWDYFTSTKIADPRLNDIRERALALDLPFGDEEAALLDGLAREAESLAA